MTPRHEFSQKIGLRKKIVVKLSQRKTQYITKATKKFIYQSN